ncbi:MAG: antibiotic biosynthesis monooxygenase family protein [Bacteroidota bacterium]
MFIRIVKMTFRPEEVETFKALFDRQKEKIRGAAGCMRLELLQYQQDPAVFMTYSWWNAEQDLENYRNSELFKSTWAETKPLFADKPEAWSMDRLIELT